MSFVALMTKPRGESVTPRALATAWRDDVRAWLARLMAEFSVDAKTVAARAKISAATVYRMMDESGRHEPNIASVRRIAGAFDVAAPGGGDAGFREDDATPYKGAVPTHLQPATPDQSVWRVDSRALELAGVMPGDLLLLDAAETPKSGDVVVAQIYDFARGAADTRIRVFDGAFLTTRTMDPALSEQPLALTSSVRIVGPIRALARAMR